MLQESNRRFNSRVTQLATVFCLEGLRYLPVFQEPGLHHPAQAGAGALAQVQLPPMPVEQGLRDMSKNPRPSENFRRSAGQSESPTVKHASCKRTRLKEPTLLDGVLMKSL